MDDRRVPYRAAIRANRGRFSADIMTVLDIRLTRLHPTRLLDISSLRARAIVNLGTTQQSSGAG